MAAGNSFIFAPRQYGRGGTRGKVMSLRRLFFIAVVLAFIADAVSQTTVGGQIDRETRWRAEDGPYIVTGDILVTRRGNLVILPGTRIIIKDGAEKTFPAPPFDKADSTLVSIRVQGAINCVGRRDRPITFETESAGLANFTWRGIILEDIDSRHSEIAFTNISGAAAAVTVKNSSVLIRNSAFENNNIGVHAVQGGAPRVYNNLFSSCFTAAIKVERSNPQIQNNIIALNNNIGLWCDGRSKVLFKYNSVFGNADGSFSDCDPEFGRAALSGRNRDSTDAFGNIVKDPIFAGSPSEARAIELDINLQTDSSRVRDKRLLNIPNLKFGGAPAQAAPTRVGSEERQLSKYSPCLNAGDPGGQFKNMDGSRNTIGPAGGPDFWNK